MINVYTEGVSQYNVNYCDGLNKGYSVRQDFQSHCIIAIITIIMVVIPKVGAKKRENGESSSLLNVPIIIK